MSDEQKKKDSKMGKILVGLVIGSAVGSILGLTMAPKSGREMRGDIAKHSKKTWGKIKEITEKKCPEKDCLWHKLHRIFFKNKSDEQDD